MDDDSGWRRHGPLRPVDEDGDKTVGLGFVSMAEGGAEGVAEGTNVSLAHAERLCEDLGDDLFIDFTAVGELEDEPRSRIEI